MILPNHSAIKIGIANGLRGTFAVMYDSNGPIMSGIGSYKNALDPCLKIEVCDWIKSEELGCWNCYYCTSCVRNKLQQIEKEDY